MYDQDRQNRLDKIAFTVGRETSEESYWINRLSGELEKSCFPYDDIDAGTFVPSDTLSPAKMPLKFQIAGDLSGKLMKLSTGSNYRLHMILTAAIITLINKYTGKEDIIVGTSIFKQEIEAEFVNTLLALRTRLNRHITFKQLLLQVRDVISEADENQNYPIEMILRKLKIPYGITDSFPLFDVVILLENIQEKKYIRHINIDMLFSFLNTGGTIDGIIQYNASRYTKETIESLVTHFRNLLEGVFTNLESCLSSISILTDREKEHLLVEMNDTEAAYPNDKTIHELFDRQAEMKPDKIALVHKGEQLTYRESKKKAGSLAGVLAAKGIGPDGIVGILMGRSLEMVIGILGILKAGGAYMPIDPGYPEERIDYMLKDSSAKILLTTNKIDLFPTGCILTPGEFLNPSEGLLFTSHHSSFIIHNSLNLAYVIYTSGTTGKPKGASVKHQSLVNYIWWASKNYVKGEEVNFPLYTSISFDLTVTSIFTPLITGNSVIIYGDRNTPIEEIEEIINDNRVEVMKLTPSHLKILKEMKPGNTCKIKRFIVGGENLESALAADIHREFNGRIEIYNEYGPTEAAVGCMIHLFDPGKDRRPSVPIGVPADNVKIHILDKYGYHAVPGVVGEIYISGDGLARGYLNRQELTAEKFCVILFGGALFEKTAPPGPPRKSFLLRDSHHATTHHSPFTIYRTGDLARFLNDGNIEFQGRIDHQVKIRGYRIELGEIENFLLKASGVKEAVVLAQEKDGGDQYICAYFVSDKENGISELREYLSKGLPDYMMPSYFVPLEKIPLTPNGKIDRKALPVPGIEAGDHYEAPRDRIEKKLVEIWAGVLEIEKEKIGINDDFFHLGGHSLKATILVSRIHKELNVKVPLAEIFKTSQIQGLAAFIKNVETQHFYSIAAVEKKEYYTLSSAQRRLSFLQQMDEKGIAYNMPSIWQLEGEVDGEKFEGGFQQLIRRHESLRTSIHMVNEEPVQVIHDEVEFAIEYDWSLVDGRRSLVKCQGRGEVSSPFIDSFIRPFDLTWAPLFRVGVIGIEKQKNILMVDMHHIISDGVSTGIFIKEFIELYAGKGLSALRLQYKDFSEWQKKQTVGKAIKEQEAYWLKEFTGEIPVLELPIDYPRPPVQDFSGSSISFEIERKETHALKSFAEEQGVTLFMLVLSIYTGCLSRISGQEDIVVGTPIAGRRHADLEPLMGMFVNTLALRHFPVGTRPFTLFLQEVKESTVKALENQDYLYEDLVEKVALRRDTGRNPLFDTIFALQNFDGLKIEIPGLKVQSFDYETRISKFDLALTAVEKKDNLSFIFEYCTKLFKQETIRRFIGYFTQTISAVIDSHDIRISGIEIIDEQEKNRILCEFNDTAADYPKDKTIHGLFEEQVERTPDNTALLGSAGIEYRAYRTHMAYISYRELNERSGRMAHLLIEKGVQPDAIVGIKMERSVEMIIGILGILKSGGVYLPIDPDYPQERIDFMLKDSAAKLLVTTGNLAEKSKKMRRGEGKRSQPATSPAYIIYTSGSTGKPKGVLLEHKNVVRLLFNDRFQFYFSETDVWTLFHSFGFDFSVWEMYGALLYGGRLVVIPLITARDPHRFLEILINRKVTVLNQTPSAFYNLIDEELKSCKRNLCLRYVIFGGEALKPARLKAWRNKYPGTKLVNMFGITETCVHVTYKEIGEREIEGDISNIGKPIPTLSTYIMDRHQRLAPIGRVGELYVGGEGVARGYLNQPGLTSERFVENSYKAGERLYRSGDLVRVCSEGEMVYLGRLDYQVQLRGFRIELEEIENRLLKHERIKEAVVIDRTTASGNLYLCAYIVTQTSLETGDLNFRVLREYLSRQLPGYMIPSYFASLEKIPLNANGKINRNALPDPERFEGISLRDDAHYIPPSGAVEKKLVEVWEKVLGRKNIGIDENFFALGGDSIKSIQIISRMSSAGYKMEVKDLFQYPVISELAPRVKKLQRISDQSVITGTIPLTPIQRRFFNESPIDAHHYNQAVMLYSKEGFDREAIKEVFSRIQGHHDAMRMTFKIGTGNNEVVQIGHGLDYPISIEVYDLKNRETGTEEFKTRVNEIQAGIDPGNGPLMRLGLFHLDDGDRLLVVVHHLVIDGVSWRILFEDIETLYSRYKRGEELVLPPKTDPFKLWSEKLSAYANSKTFLKEKTYWQKIESVEPPLIPKDFDVDDNYIKDTGSVSFTLGEKQTGLLLTKVNEAFRTEVNDILLTALGLGIKKTFGQDRILIALEGHGREKILEGIDISRTLGWFTSIYPVLIDLSYAADPGRQVKEIKEILRRIPNKGIGYGILKYLTGEENKKEIEFKLKPQISFNYLGQFDADVKQRSTFEIAKESVGNSQSPNNRREYLLELSGIISDNRLTVTISFNKRHFKPGTIPALGENLEIELKRIIEFCCSRGKRELTPSDFTYKGLSVEKIHRLIEEYPGIEDLYTLTPMQEGMLFHALADGWSHSYFEQISYRFQGELDIHLVEKSLTELAKRHDILRTAFVHEDIQRPVQLVGRDRGIGFYYQDISKINERGEKDKVITEFKEKDKKRSFDLSKGELMRVSIFRTGNSEYEFAWSFHHILMDGWCLGIINTDFFEIYTSYWENRHYRLPGVTPYRAYIQWLEKQDKEESARYWESYLDSYEEQTGVPKTRISMKEENKYRNEAVSIEFDREKTASLNKLAAGNHATLNTVTQTLWGILLGKYNGKEDAVFGAVVSGRPHGLEGVESMVGLFINTVPVRIHFEGKMKFSRLLQKVQEEALASEPYHYHPLAEIQSGSTLKQNLIDHLFIFENYPIADQIEGYGRGKNKIDKASLKLTNIEVFEQTNYDFNVILAESDRLGITFRYNGNVYEGDFVERIAKHLSIAADQVTKNWELEIRDLTLLPGEEKNRLLYEFNGTGADYPKDKTIHRLFEEQVEKRPFQVALVGPKLQNTNHKPGGALRADFDAFGGLTAPGDYPAFSVRPINLTYKELNEESNRLAYTLLEKGAHPDTIVGIMIERSVDMVIGILGILKAGGAYMPIDRDYPQERIDYMLKDSNGGVLVTTPKLKVKVKDEVKGKFIEIIDISDLSSFSPSTSTLTCQVSPANLAYVIYTSGTTGKPKAVMVQHINVVRLVKNTNYVEFKPGDRILPTGALEFDASTFEIWGSLLNGLELSLVDNNIILAPGELKHTLQRNRITTIWLTSPLFNQLLDQDLEIFKGLRNLLVGGDILSPSHIRRLKNKYPQLKIINGYGPTENTTFSTTYRIDKEYGGNIPIGKPIANSMAYIVDRYIKPVPIGIIGELLVGGDGVARGYLNNPELTSEKFIIAHELRRMKVIFNKKFLEVSEPFFKKVLTHRRQRLYRTGDLARWLMDGNIEFLGRIDHQVKIRGFRVELGEIENRLLKFSGVKEAVVLARAEDGVDKYICAYFVSDKDYGISVLREYLSKGLPAYMTPSYFVRLERIPLTPSGKVDRGALPEPVLKAGQSYTAPGNEMEKKMVGLWSEVLGRDEMHTTRLKTSMGIDDNFFELGGHSLKATILVSKIHKAFQVNVKPAEIFKTPTIRGLSDVIKKSAPGKYISIGPAEKKEYYRLSAAQERIYTALHLEVGTTSYNMPIILRLKGELDREHLQETFRKLIERHESLRTSFEIIGNEPVQRVHDKVEFAIEYRGFGEGITALRTYIRAFNLTRAPLLRVYLSEIGDREYTMMMDISHLISDGVSSMSMARDLMLSYNREELPLLKIQYKDFSGWESRRFLTGDIKKQEDFWLDVFKGEIPVLELHTDFPRPDVRNVDAGDMVNVVLKESTKQRLYEIIEETDSTLFTILLAVYNVLLNKYSGQEDIVVGSVVTGRTHEDLENVMGVFINMLPLRNHPQPGKQFRHFLGEVKENAWHALGNQDYPLEELVKKLGIQNKPGRHPLFDTEFAVNNIEFKEITIPGLKMELCDNGIDFAKFDLHFLAVENNNSLNIVLRYSTELYKKTTAEKILDHFVEIIGQVMENPWIKLEDIEITVDFIPSTSTLREKDQGDFSF